MSVEDLQVDSSLLDAHFDGYKLSLDALPIKECPLDVKAIVTQPSDAQYSILHMKVFADANVIASDSFSSKDGSHTLFGVLTDNSVHKFVYDTRTYQWTEVVKVASLSATSSEQSLPTSMSFPSATIAVVCNGVDKVTVYATDEHRTSWKEYFSFRPIDTEGCYMVETCALENQIHILLQSIIDHKSTDDSDKITFDHKLHWIVIEDDGGMCKVVRKQEVCLGGPVDSITLDATCENAIIIGTKLPTIVNDSQGLVKKVQPTVEQESHEHAGLSEDPEAHEKPVYIWTEKGEEVSVVFSLLEPIDKKDVHFMVTTDTIVLSIGDVLLLHGTLGGPVKREESTWTFSNEDNLLEVTLFKSSTGVRWSELVKGDQRGKYQLDTDLVEQAANLLQRFTSEHSALGGIGTSENFNSDQLEECDMMTDDDVMSMYWWNRDSQDVVKQCDVTGHQFLFASRPFGGEPARFCLRHDVDGLLWSVDGAHPIHQTTFNAFGYVQASKTLRRWCGAAPDHSYAFIAEGKNHAFIYWQPNDIDTDLRNRKTSRQVSQVARQQIVSLKRRTDGISLDDVDRDDRILGVHPTNDTLFIATSDCLYAVRLK